MTKSIHIEGTWEEISSRAAEFKGRRLRLTVLDPPTPAAPLSLSDRLQFLRLPRAERARILEEQAQRMVEYYEQDSEWRDLTSGDIVDYQTGESPPR